MALRIGECAVRGEIDNRLRDHVVGRIWIKGREQPLRLNLQGNCWRDIAGHLFRFECTPTESLQHPDGVHDEQEGAVGDMTASRKVNTWGISFEEAEAMRKAGREVPVKKANCLYLEWFSRRNGRVVLETVDFRVVEMSDPAWRMSREEERLQRKANVEAMKDFMARVDAAMEEGPPQWSPDDDKPMDEFAWERELRESDARTERYGKVIEKYEGHPDAERLIAREMGWNWLDDALDADERGVFDEARAAAAEEGNYPPLVPVPEREGDDWIRTENGNIRHPLAHRAAQVSIAMWKKCDELGLIKDDRDNDVADMTFQAHMLSAKLAGALNGLPYREDPDPGFIVACLKRALQYFDPVMAAAKKIEQRKALDPALLKQFRRELFEIREEILNLMKRFRHSL